MLHKQFFLISHQKRDFFSFSRCFPPVVLSLLCHGYVRPRGLSVDLRSFPCASLLQATWPQRENVTFMVGKWQVRLGFLYPPTQVSTATSQGCLYSCDACTLRAVHLLSHSPQPADLTWTAGCTRDKATAIWSIFLCQGRLFLFCSPGCGNLQVLVWRISFYPRLQSPTSPIPGGGPATQTFPSVQPSRRARARHHAKGHSTMHRGHQGPIIALTGVSVGLITYV